MVIVINDAGAITAFRTTPIAGAKPVAPPPPAPAAQKDNVQAPSTPADQTVTPAKQD